MHSKLSSRNVNNGILAKMNGGSDKTNAFPVGDTINTEKWVDNFSSRELNVDEIAIIGKGMKFCVTQPTIPVNAIVVSTELICSQMHKVEADGLRNQSFKE